MKKVILTGILLLSCSLVFASPSTTLTIPNSFSANTTIQSASVNGDFNQVANIFNSHTHTDITQLGTVTTGNWAGTAITLQYGGTGKDNSASVTGAIPYVSTGTIATLAAGTSGQVLQSKGALNAPSWVNAGKVAQIVNSYTTAQVTDNTHMPYTSVPQNTDGSQALTLAITPTSATNILKIDVDLVVSDANVGGDVINIALFQDSTAAALDAVPTFWTGAGEGSITLSYFMTAGTTSATTFKARFGALSTTSYLNSHTNGNALYGGSFCRSTMSVTEYMP